MSTCLFIKFGNSIIANACSELEAIKCKDTLMVCKFKKCEILLLNNIITPCLICIVLTNSQLLLVINKFSEIGLIFVFYIVLPEQFASGWSVGYARVSPLGNILCILHHL